MSVQKNAETEIAGRARSVRKGCTWLGDALLSIVIAAPYAIRLLGLDTIRPWQLGWLGGDTATYYIAWAMFRLTDGLHWPLTYTPALGYPIGESIALLDPIPIAALLLKPISSALPGNFQYLGLYSVVALILQLYFGVRLLRFLLPDRRFVVWVGALFFMLAPPLTRRFGGHFALTSHWLILAALLLYARAASDKELSVHRWAWWSAALTVVAVGINPYLATMVLGVLAAACLTVVLKGRLTWAGTVGILAVLVISAGLSGSAFGLIRIGNTASDFAGAGYRHYSMNLLAPIDPSPSVSPILAAQRTFTNGQYEGYNYLGAGMLGLLMLGGVTVMAKSVQIHKADLVTWAPIALCAAFFALLAVSTLVTLGNTVLVDLDPSERLTPYLAFFRASGRLFWPAYYLLTLCGIVVVGNSWGPRWAAVILGAALALQIYDTQSVRQQVRGALTAFSPPAQLTSPVWQTLNREHRHLMVLPPWQCQGDTPGGADGFRIFGFFAAEQGLTINSYYAARYRQDTLEFHCNAAIEQVATKGLVPGSAYVVSPRVAQMIAKRSSGAEHCYDVDGLILCTLSPLAGQPRWRPGESMRAAVPVLPLSWKALTAQDAGYFVSGWTSVQPGFGVWSTGREAVLAYRLPSKPAKSLRLTLLAVTGRHPVTFTLIHEKGRLDSVIPAKSPPTIQLSTVRLPIGSGPAVHKITVLTKQLLSPADQGYNADGRKLGIGVHSIGADGCAPSSVVELRSSDSPDSGCDIK